MTEEQLEKLLGLVQRGDLTIPAALDQLRSLPYADLGFARVDHHRSLRSGFPEVIFAPGKTDDQIVQIFFEIGVHGSNVLATRVTPEQAAAVEKKIPTVRYESVARLLTWQQQPIAMRSIGKVVIVSAGTGDIPVAEEAAATALFCGSPVDRLWDVGVAGIHRVLQYRELLASARVIVVVAGMEGALASVVKGLVRAPVIAVPTSVGYGASFGGLAALLGMMSSCATGVVAVNIDNGFGAGFTAALIAQA